MRIFFSEFPANYDKYHFPYQVLAATQYGDDPVKIYQAGFLPFRSKKDLYYLSRSTRVRLSDYQASSENRRILRKVEYLTLMVQPLDQFEYTAEVQKFCSYAAKSMGKDDAKIMPTAAIRKLLTGQANADHIITFRAKENNTVQGYVAIVLHGNFCHYAHPFINPDSEDKNLNIGMMTKAVEWCKSQHKQFIYLGTCYTPSSLYKTQFSGFEFYTGFEWHTDLEELKYLINRTNPEYHLQDSEYLEKYLPQDFELTESETEFRIKQK